MVDLKALKTALEAVLNDLARHETTGEPGQHQADGAKATDTAGEDYSQALHRLSDYLAGGMDEAGDVLGAHPFVAVSAAFMLGVAVGRMSRS